MLDITLPMCYNGHVVKGKYPMTRYNGWLNWETWNVALWIGNDETIYRHAKQNKNLGYRKWAKRWIDEFGEYQTSDGCDWLSHDLDDDRLDEMMAEL